MPRWYQFPTISILILGLAVACHESVSTDGSGNSRIETGSIKAQAGDSQIGAPGALVPIRPSVKVVDENDSPLPGIEVKFEVTGGGGLATGTDARSDSAGVATVGSWRLGPTPGTNTMAATVSGASITPYVFTAMTLCDCWNPLASLNVARFNAGAAAVNGKLYIVGGQNYTDLSLPIEEYDPATKTWTTRGIMPAYDKIGVAALDGRIYAAGTGWDASTTWLKWYDPATDKWTELAPPPTPRQHLDAVAIGGRLYAFGGRGRGMLNILESYDPASDTWTVKAPMITGREFEAVAVVNGILYVMGGAGNGDVGQAEQALSSVESYDPATDTWTSRAPLPVPLMEAAAAVVNGIIYVSGGGPISNNGKPYVYAYDPAKDAWTVQPPMRIGRSKAMAVTLDGMLYEIGGWDRDTGPLANVEAYRP